MARINRTNMRADKTNILGDTNMRRSDGTVIFNPGDGECLRKIVDRSTLRCPECDEVGRIDHRGDTICDDDECAVVITDWEDGSDAMTYPDVGQWYSEATTESSHRARGGSGHPLTRVPALNPAGPSGDDGL